MEQPYMLPIPYCQYHVCWCPGNLKSQAINRTDNDQFTQSNPRSACKTSIAMNTIKIWVCCQTYELKNMIKTFHVSCSKHITKWTRYVHSTPMSEVTPFTIQYIRPPHHGHTSQYHGHEWMTHILFIPCQLATPFLRYSNFRLWPWNSKVKVMGVVKGQCHTRSPVSYQLLFISHQSDQQFLRYSYFKIWPWNIQGQGH